MIDTGPRQKGVGLRLPGGPAPAGSLPAWRYRAAAKSKVAGIEADTAAPAAEAAEAKAPTKTIAAAAEVPERWARSVARPAGCEGASMVGRQTSSTGGVTDSGQDEGGKDGGSLSCLTARSQCRMAHKLPLVRLLRLVPVARHGL